MDFGEKLDKLRDDRGMTLAALCKRLRIDTPQFYRWKEWAASEESQAQFASLAVDLPANDKGTPRRQRGHNPSRLELIRICEEFDADLRWLIDDNMSWEERPKLVGPIAERFKQLSPVEALRALELFAQHSGNVDISTRNPGKK